MTNFLKAVTYAGRCIPRFPSIYANSPELKSFMLITISVRSTLCILLIVRKFDCLCSLHSSQDLVMKCVFGEFLKY